MIFERFSNRFLSDFEAVRPTITKRGGAEQTKQQQNMRTILVTGHAGFIGSNLVRRLFREMTEGTIVGVDNLNDYYDPSTLSLSKGSRSTACGSWRGPNLRA